jgi:hypothetical protein
VEVGADAEAAAARLDPEQVAEHGDDEVAMQQPGRMAQAEREDREPVRVGSPRISMFGFAPHDASARRATPRPRRAISAAPTSSLSSNTIPARIESTMAGVPPSSRTEGSGW